MNRKERQVIAKRVVHYYTKIVDFNKLKTVKHFTEEGEDRNTIYKILQRYDRRGSALFKPRSSSKRTVATEKVVKIVIMKLNNTYRLVRKTAAAVGISKSTVQRIKER